jgi:hypothetical protein
MNRLFQTLVTLAWGLWFGGLVMLFMTVTSLFHTFPDRQLAGTVASGVFHSFDLFRLGVAAGALIATFLWRVVSPSRLKSVVFLFFALAVIAATYSAVILTPQLEQLRAELQTQSPQFGKLHAMSMCVYLAETLFVLGAGLTLPWASQSEPKRSA